MIAQGEVLAQGGDPLEPPLATQAILATLLRSVVPVTGVCGVAAVACVAGHARSGR